MAGITDPIGNGFILTNSINDKEPHRFEAYKLDVAHAATWSGIVNDCLRAWQILAEAFYNNLPDTGFEKLSLIRYLNPFGVERLPTTPDEDNDITHNPAITDVTEIVALRCLTEVEKELIIPQPRVLNKAMLSMQHPGIDAIGYRKKEEEYILYLIEVMASVDVEHPPSTVYGHNTQLLTDTLNKSYPERLLKDLLYAHDSSDNIHRQIFNSFIVAIVNHTLNRKENTKAVPILVRRRNEVTPQDWAPFYSRTGEYERAIIPSIIHFIAIDIQHNYSTLLDKIKISCTPPISGMLDTNGGA